MKNSLRIPVVLLTLTLLSSCLKEYSTEVGDGNGAGVIIGADCRISKIGYADSASGVGLGSITALINAADNTTDITGFDSLTLSIDFNAIPQYFSDTVYIDPKQYFIREATTKRIKHFHGFVDPAFPGSPEYDVDYIYDVNGLLSQKRYGYTLLPGIYFQTVTYTYSGKNLTGMVSLDEFTGNIIKDASLTYYSNIAPKNYIYLFPDESANAEFNQFYNFGSKSTNAVKSLKVRYYNPGNVVADSTVSAFSGYTMSRDNYVVGVYMIGDDQSSIPAAEGKLSFSYKCK